MFGFKYVTSDFEEKILFEMMSDGWYKDMPKHEMKKFYEEWWSKRLNYQYQILYNQKGQKT